MAMTYSFSNNSFIAEEIINYIVKNSNDNLLKASTLYVDSMLYLRKYPHFKRSVNQAAILLDNALAILSKNDTYDAHFHKIFNRNGYALTLFKYKKISEALNLEIELYNQLKNLDFHNEKRDMHLSVILYNIYQCYRVNGDDEYADGTLEELLEMDSNDYHYRYGYINYLLQKK